jgi:Peptidase family M1 domain
MARRRLLLSTVLTVAMSAAFVGVTSAGAAGAAAAAADSGHGCSPGAHTLAPVGSRMYPETGNGGYTSLHTNVHMVYDATTNMFLPGNKVALTDRANQCLTSFSLDFERQSANTTEGPDMTVDSVTVNGAPATFAFVQPTYPGDPNGQADPDPLAHEASQNNPVGGPDSNPLPPACSPELPNTSVGADSLDGTQCPANKLVITPRAPVRDGSTFTVVVNYTGRPGVHNDGDGTTEGWFRATGGSFVTTEPVGTEDWMPLNDYPAAKPTYDFFDTVNAGKTTIANGDLVSQKQNAPDANFPAGSVTYHWHSAATIASYLVEDSVGNYTFSTRLGSDGITYKEAQDSAISATQQAANQAIMDQQQDITDFESQFNGPFPFDTDGVAVGTPPASFEEEMQTMITFAGGRVGLSTLYHENMHQWWGDNVSEGGYAMTFFKEGFAQLAQYMLTARNAETAAGGPGTAAGQAAFQASLIAQFNTNYARAGSFWSAAPSNPTPFGLFSNSATYQRPATAYIALWQILGTDRFTKVLRAIQRVYGGGSITEPQLEAAFRSGLPSKSAACKSQLSQFFTEWFDTAYPNGAATEPDITGPGLAGPGFYGTNGGDCKNV